MQNYLVFQSLHRYFQINNSKYIWSWKPKGLSDETITPYATSDNSLTPLIDHYGSKVRVKFTGSYLKQPNKLRYDKGHKENIYTVYILVLLVLTITIPHWKNVYLVQLL